MADKKTLSDLQSFGHIMKKRLSLIENGSCSLSWKQHKQLGNQLLQHVGLMKLNQFEGQIGKTLVTRLFRMIIRNDTKSSVRKMSEWTRKQLDLIEEGNFDLLQIASKGQPPTKRLRLEIPLEQIRHQSRLWIEANIIYFFLQRVGSDIEF
jgi:hypothetical protein